MTVSHVTDDTFALGSGTADGGSPTPARRDPEQSPFDPVTEAALRRIEQAPPPLPVRPHHPGSGAAITKTAAQLFAECDPTDPKGWRKLLQRELPNIYVPSVLKESNVRWLLGHTVTNGGRLFIHGAAPGVGAKTLAIDYARAFNQAAHARNDPRRIAFLMIGSGTTTVNRLLDDLGTLLQARISHTELRRGPTHLVMRILGAAARLNVTTLMIAQASKASVAAREVIGSLLHRTDPRYHVDLEPHPLQEHARGIGVILIDHLAPEVLFRPTPDVLLQLKNRVVELRPFNSYAEIADAMRRADIGLDDLDLEDPDDLSMVHTVASQTQGLLAQMHPLLELIDVIATASGNVRPSPELVAAALPLYRRMVDLNAVRSRTPSGRMYALRARSILRAKDLEHEEAAGDRAGAADGAALPEVRDTGRAKALKKKHDEKERATREARAVGRKGFITVFPEP